VYHLPITAARRITSAELSRALGDLDCPVITEADSVHLRRMSHLGAIEALEARGARYSGHDFDALSGALNFLDAVEPAHGLRDN
jgi:hypothetical protein